MEGEGVGLGAVVLAMEVPSEAAEAEAVREEGIEGVGSRVGGETCTEDLGSVGAV